MLIITRKIGEGISIGDIIQFSVVKIVGRNVGIKIDSPSLPNIDQEIATIKMGKSLEFTDEIKISILGIRGRQVRFGIESPGNTVVHRQEIYVKIQNSDEGYIKPKDWSFWKKAVTKLGNFLIKIGNRLKNSV